MKKCDVCGKNTLLPEKFGTVNICKVCFMKVNGLLWKHQYDRYEDAKKQCYKVLESARKHNFSESVIVALGEFFNNQMNRMISCDCCGSLVRHLEAVGKTHICKLCFGKINISAWKETEYEDNEEVENNRKKVLKVANKYNFPQIVVEEINLHFDDKIQKGLICSSNSYRGQKLKVYETYCILITREDFDIEENSKEYGKALKSNYPKENLISNSVAKSLANSVFAGGIVKAGINIATSTAINAVTDVIVPEKGMFKVVRGTYKIDYLEYDHIDFQKVADNEVGFIRFRNSRFAGNTNEDIVFIFDTDDGKEKIYNQIQKWSSITKQTTIQETSGNQQSQSSSFVSIADEILKFKNLLDIGAITQEEFDAKKKYLLSLE